jgi:hypothetical protein
VYDFWGMPKLSLRAFEESSQPIGVFMELKDKPVALWVVNDTLESYSGCTVEWTVSDQNGRKLLGGSQAVDVSEDCAVVFATSRLIWNRISSIEPIFLSTTGKERCWLETSTITRSITPHIRKAIGQYQPRVWHAHIHRIIPHVSINATSPKQTVRWTIVSCSQKSDRER